jgi:uncharacterized protein (DUF1778 family)
MSESATKKLVRFFQAGIRGNPPIKFNEVEYNALCEILENPPQPTPALILAMEKGRRLRDALAQR